MSLPFWRSYMFVSTSRMIGYSISPGVSAKSGIGPTLIIWCTAGVSGIDAPAMRAMRGLQTPQATNSVSPRRRPCRCARALTRPLTTSMPVTSVLAEVTQPAVLLRVLAHQRAGAQRVDDADRRACRSRRGSRPCPRRARARRPRSGVDQLAVRLAPRGGRRHPPARAPPCAPRCARPRSRRIVSTPSSSYCASCRA